MEFLNDFIRQLKLIRNQFIGISSTTGSSEKTEIYINPWSFSNDFIRQLKLIGNQFIDFLTTENAEETESSINPWSFFK